MLAVFKHVYCAEYSPPHSFPAVRHLNKNNTVFHNSKYSQTSKRIFV